jgi:hypothetical protein
MAIQFFGIRSTKTQEQVAPWVELSPLPPRTTCCCVVVGLSRRVGRPGVIMDLVYLVLGQTSSRVPFSMAIPRLPEGGSRVSSIGKQTDEYLRLEQHA